MWPWGHLAVGYLAFSLFFRLRGRIVTAASAVVLVFGSQLPDLVDKPLAWVADITASGFGIAHSVFVAVPLALLGLALSIRHDRPDLGWALLIGWWSHLVADVLVALVDSRTATVERVLWPVAEIEDPERTIDLFARLTEYYSGFIDRVQTTDNVLLVVLYLAPVPLAVILWLADGAPVARHLYQRLRPVDH